MNDVLRIISVKIRKWMPPRMRNARNYFFLFFSCFAAVFLLLLSPWLCYLKDNKASYSAGLSGLFIFINAIAWHRGLHLHVAHFFYQLTLMGVICYNVLQNGGVASPYMVWFAIVPLLPLFCMSRRWAIVWLIISFSSIFIIYFLQIYGIVEIPVSVKNETLAISATMYMLLCVTQIILILTYDSAVASNLNKFRRQNERLRLLSSELRLASAHKDRFLATVTHELRTPLNAIMGYLNLITTEAGVSAAVQEYTQYAQNSSDHLLMVINDLLDFSQISQGKLIFIHETVDVHKAITSAFRALAAKAQDKGLFYTMELSKDLPKYLCLDSGRLTQILLNLLGNSIKFTNVGEVRLRVNFNSGELLKETGELLINLMDSGIGICEKDLNKIFEPFVQLNNSSNFIPHQALKGNGLGLSIVKNLIDSWGGSIHVQSNLGEGTCFALKLPVKVEEKSTVTSEIRPIIENFQEFVRILLVDDHPINRIVARATISKTIPNAVIKEASNGGEAINIMKSENFDLVLMDIIMPDISGIDVVKKIREEAGEPYCNVNVVAFTANVSEETVKECREVGMDSILAKPFNAEMLINTVKKYIPN